MSRVGPEEDTIGTLIRGGTVVTATDVTTADVLMDGGLITALGTALDASAHTTVDASGCYVFRAGSIRTRTSTCPSAER